MASDNTIAAMIHSHFCELNFRTLRAIKLIAIMMITIINCANSTPSANSNSANIASLIKDDLGKIFSKTKPVDDSKKQSNSVEFPSSREGVFSIKKNGQTSQSDCNWN